MKWLLVILTPDTPASIVAGLMSFLSFAIAVLELMNRDFAEARGHLNLSMGILVGLFLMKYISARATYQLAAEADHRLHQHIHNLAVEAKAEEPVEAEIHAKEITGMTDLAKDLKLALGKIHPDSPLREKYEATLELIGRILAKERHAQARRGAG